MADDTLAADLAWLIDVTPGLAESRIRGTDQPWRPADLTPQARAERDRQARAEFAERSAKAPGEHPSPVHEHLVDLFADVVIAAERLAENLTQPAWCPMIAPPSSAFADPRPYLRLALACLPLVDDEDLLAWAATGARCMVTAVATATGEVYVGQHLDVVCPWCRGVTPETPAGGARTWRVRELPGGQTAIVCEGVCEPPLRDVGTWWHGQPCWPMREWDWLAGRLRTEGVA